jgi:hypothetical protein
MITILYISVIELNIMKILEYKLVTSYILCYSTNTKVFNYRNILNTENFEIDVKKYLDKGYTPIGGVSISFDEPHFILTQTLVKYEE